MHFLCLFLSFVACINAAAVRPLPVSADPFYEAPDNIDDYKLGDIMRTREAPHNIQALYINMNVKNVWQFLIRSEDSFGVPLPISSTIIEPYNADSSKLFSYQFAQDAALKNCSASYALQKGQIEDPFYTQLEGVAMEWGVQKGWFVNVPDHEGPKGAFCVGPLAGKAALNSIRAALKTGNITGVDLDAKVVMWGYSGGTIPTGWAASMQPDYAPDLKENLIGAAVGGWVVNVSATAEIVEGTLFAGLVPSAMEGIMAEYPHLRDSIYGELSNTHVELFKGARKMCIVPSLLDFFGSRFFTRLYKWFKDGFGLLHKPDVLEVINAVSLGLSNNISAPEIPFYIYHSKSDDVVPFPPAYKAYEKLCKLGAKSIELHTMDRPNHIMGLIEGAESALEWIEERFNGTEATQGCKITSRPKSQEPFGAAIPVNMIVRSIYNLVEGNKLGDDSGANVTTSDMLLTIEKDIKKKIMLLLS